MGRSHPNPKRKKDLTKFLTDLLTSTREARGMDEFPGFTDVQNIIQALLDKPDHPQWMDAAEYVIMVTEIGMIHIIKPVEHYLELVGERQDSVSQLIGAAGAAEPDVGPPPVCLMINMNTYSEALSNLIHFAKRYKIWEGETWLDREEKENVEDIL